jgi:hypothetical protein
VLLVLVALCYSSSYHVVFRNSGFAAATVIIRLALTAPRYVNVLLGLGAAVFAVGLSLAYNTFSPAMRSPSAERVRGGAPGAEARTVVVGLHAAAEAETRDTAADAARVPADRPQGVL